MAALEVGTEILPLHADFTQTGFRPYVLDLEGAGLEAQSGAQSIALVVMTRAEGLLLALPELALSPEVLAAGDAPEVGDFIGPHIKIEVRAATMDEDNLHVEPVLVEGKTMAVLLLDVSNEALDFLQPLVKEDLEHVVPFELPADLLVPFPSELVSSALAWARGAREQHLDRVQFYSAEEVPVTPTSEPPVPKRQTRRRTPGGTGQEGTGELGKTASPKKRPTVAQLAESISAITDVLPAITNQLQELNERTMAMERGAKTQEPASRPSVLRQPLSGSAMAMVGLQDPLSTPAQLIKEIPPPKSSAIPTKQALPRVSFGPSEVEEMTADLGTGNESAFAQAMLEQAKALTMLVTHMQASSSDPLQDLGSSSSSLSSKGALSRAKLQAELAMHRGTFFTSVLQSMGRRMHPSMSSEVEMSTLRDRGVTPSQYLERFGGYGKTRDIGFIVWQVGLIMNFLQEDNVLAAKDSLALLFVMLEQAAMDGGSLQVGLLLALVEDPPQSLFSMRSVAMGAHPRPFAPTANQRWITSALQYLKEMDVISTK